MNAELLTDPHPQSSGMIKTTNNQPITINGNSVRAGTTVLSGSTFETPDGVGATLEMGSATLDISPGSDLTVSFSASEVKVTLRRGCVILRTRGNCNGVIVTADGTTIETGKDKYADVCISRTGAPIVNQGAAANAGAGAGTVAAGSGVNRTLVAVLIAGGGFAALAAILLATGGDNPSPSTP
jgi:hypothetical protein